jgi:hypothetical protein
VPPNLLPITIRLDPQAPSSNLVIALATLLLQRAKVVLRDGEMKKAAEPTSSAVDSAANSKPADILGDCSCNRKRRFP